MSKRVFTIIISSLIIYTSSFAQTQEQDTISPHRPKIGLVLSGGGAKGLAHVGVLKAIDKAGLKVDYITGTSMGAIIAAMYAAGYSGEEIGDIAQSMDWANSILGTVDYKNISIENKPDFQSFLFEIPVENYIHLQPFNTGVIEPIEVALKLSEVFFPVYKVKDFSQLQIPFKCIATDLRNGDAVILDKGDLPFAVRSSMAIPGAFSATSYKGTKLVDGGIVRNFPVKDVREMGAEFVIGVNLFQGLPDPNELTSPLDVMMQATNFRDASDLIEEKSICDMVIEPDMSKFSAASFSSSDVISAIGDSIGADFYPLFKQLADSLHTYYGLDYINPNSRMKPYDKTVYVEDLDIEGLRHTNKEFLLHNLQMKTKTSYTPIQLNEAFRHAYSSGYYKNLRYELIPVDSSSNHIRLRCIVDENPMQAIGLALSYNSFTGASLNLGYKLKNLLGRQSVTNIKVALSETFRLKFNNRVAFGRKYNNYLEQAYSFGTFEIPSYDINTKSDIIRRFNISDSHITWGMIITPTSYASATIGFENNHRKADAVGKIGYRCTNFYFKLNRQRNTTNRKYLPTSGVNLETELYTAFKPRYKQKVFEQSEYVPDIDRDNIYRISFHGQFFQPLTSRFTLHETLAVRASWGDKIPNNRTLLGGGERVMPNQIAFIGLKTAQRDISSMAMGRMSFQYRLYDELYTTIHWNSAITFLPIDQYVNESPNRKYEEILHGAGITAAYNLSFLPFDITLMYSPDYKFNIHVNVGFLF
ncbi:MAG: patatin-like phospholipase family protein [Bacteroidia bacterium]|nr:patatin-like phospholipase family protein [Bacteroidia bacterium]